MLCRRPLALSLSVVVASGCGAVVSSGTITCSDDKDCVAAATCSAGRCVPVDGGPEALLDGGALLDAGAPTDSGPTPDGGPARDAGPGASDGGDRDREDAGPQDAGGGVDAGACPSGCAPGLRRAPIEVCDDGFDNDCDGAVDETPCGFIRRIGIQTFDALPAGMPLRVELPPELVTPDGNDVRVWRYASAEDAFVELPRVLDPDHAWSGPKELWFALDLPISASQLSTAAMRLTWGALPDEGAPPPLGDERDVFSFADFFEWGPSEDGAPRWTFVEESGEDLDIVDGALVFTETQERDSKPYAHASFPALSGPFELDVRFHWSGSDNDDDYIWRLLLGDASMPLPHPTNDELTPQGVGPNLVWGHRTPSWDLPFPQALAVDGQAQNPNTYEDGVRVLGNAPVSSSVRVRLRGDTATGAFDVTVDGTEHLSFVFPGGPLGSLSRLLLFTTELTAEADGSTFNERRFEHVLLRPVVDAEPDVRLVEDAPCN